jgi:hypothetical protein
MKLIARINVPKNIRDKTPPILSTGVLVSLTCDGMNFIAIIRATMARGNVIRNTDPQLANVRRYPEIKGPRAAIAAPTPDHNAIARVRFGSDHKAAISARVVGKAIPAAKPPIIRAKIRISMDGA